MQPWYVRKAEKKSGSICKAGIRQKALGAAVGRCLRCTRTLPSTSLHCWSYQCYRQALSGPQELGTCPAATCRYHCWAQNLQGHSGSPGKEAGNSRPCTSEGVQQSLAALFTYLMVLHHFPCCKKLFNKWAVWATTATKIAHTGKPDPIQVSRSPGPFVSIKIIEHEISY